jgi:hypothetical protein
MSNSKNAIKEIKNLMKQFGFLAEESTLMSFKLEDNTILQASKLEAGESIVKINDSFEQVTLEDGSYRLVENFNIEVVDGKITAVKEIFIDAKLVDGTQIKVEGDMLGEGAKVIVVTPDAEIPAPDGVHELEDGTKVETKDGVIVSVTEALGEVKDMEDEVAVDVPKEIAPVAEEVVQAVVEALLPLMEEVKVLVEEMKKMKDGMKVMNAEFSAFKSEPAAKKIADGKTEFNKVSDSNIDARVAAIMSMRNK